jgi:hypothetical protein
MRSLPHEQHSKWIPKSAMGCGWLLLNYCMLSAKSLDILHVHLLPCCCARWVSNFQINFLLKSIGRRQGFYGYHSDFWGWIQQGWFAEDEDGVLFLCLQVPHCTTTTEIGTCKAHPSMVPMSMGVKGKKMDSCWLVNGVRSYVKLHSFSSV